MSTSRLQGCRAYRSRLDAILDGAGSMEARHGVEAHAEGCAACAAALRASAEIRRWIDSSPEPELTNEAEDAFVTGVLSRIEDIRTGTPTCRWKSGTKRSFEWRLVSVATIAAAAALVLLLLRPERTIETQSVARPAASAQAAPPLVAPSVAPPSPATRPPDQEILPDPIPVDLAAFTEGLEALPVEAVRPDVDLSTRDGFSSIVAAFGVDGAQRAARSLLQASEPNELAPMAARLLGQRADLRDRRLLVRTLPITGMAGVLALAERGSSGIECLWDLACSEASAEEESRRLAARALMRLSQAGVDPLPSPLEPSRNPGLAASLIASSGDGAAARLLDLFLGDGRGEWLDAWQGMPDRDESLMAALGRQRRDWSKESTARKLAAIERARFAPALDFVMEILGNGDLLAVRTLSALPGDQPAMALLAAARAGRLRSDIEDLAWASLADHQPEVLLQLMLERDGEVSDTAVTVTSSLALILDSCPSARRLLFLSGLEPELPEERRVKALLLAFEGVSDKDRASLLDDSTRARLHELTSSGRAPLAAAAWIACHRLDDLPSEPSPPLLRALTRSATGYAHYLRIVRVIEKARPRNRSL